MQPLHVRQTGRRRELLVALWAARVPLRARGRRWRRPGQAPLVLRRLLRWLLELPLALLVLVQLLQVLEMVASHELLVLLHVRLLLLLLVLLLLLLLQLLLLDVLVVHVQGVLPGQQLL